MVREVGNNLEGGERYGTNGLVREGRKGTGRRITVREARNSTGRRKRYRAKGVTCY